MAERNTSGGSYSRWRKRRRLRQEAQHLIKEARRILKKYHVRLKEDVVKDVDRAIVALNKAQDGGQISSMRDRLESLEKLVERHLSFGRKSAMREYTESIGIAVIVALLLRAFVVEAFKIPSGSMIPTLKVGDHIFVNKFLYGLRIPWTHLKYFEVRKPKRGEVIVFIYPKDRSKDFIKRVVAVGGDTVELRKNHVYINGEPIKRKKLPGPCLYADTDEVDTDHWVPRVCEAYQEKQDGTSYRVIQDPDRFKFDFSPHKVPADHVFVMGDNRDNSHDSRFWGFVPNKEIKGKAMFIWWSRGEPQGIRWDRFFSLVHTVPGEKVPVKP